MVDCPLGKKPVPLEQPLQRQAPLMPKAAIGKRKQNSEQFESQFEVRRASYEMPCRDSRPPLSSRAKLDNAVSRDSIPPNVDNSGHPVNDLLDSCLLPGNVERHH